MLSKRHMITEKSFAAWLLTQKNMRVPTDLVPRCPVCGEPMTMNLQCDNTFVQDEDGMRRLIGIRDFMRRHQDRNPVLELGVEQEYTESSLNIRSGNTPIKIEKHLMLASI